MPTGYTAGIIDGKIKTFTEFAKLCMRAFGATVHMRDENMDMDYIPRETSKYHIEQLELANKRLKDATNLSDDEIISKRILELEESKLYYEKSIVERNENVTLLNIMLKEAEQYSPPTSEHTGIKDFMIQQITETIKYDGDIKYLDEQLTKINKELLSINPAVIRCEMIADAEKSISYHSKEYADEKKRCEDSNKWVEDFINSLPN